MSSSTNRLKSCCFLINSFEKVLYLSELDARKYYGIKLLQSIVIHPVKCMAIASWISFNYILQPHREVVPAFANEPPGHCVPINLWFPILSFLNWYWSQAITLLQSPVPHASPSSDLTLLEKVLKKGHVFGYSTFWDDLPVEVPTTILLATLNAQIHIVIR